MRRIITVGAACLAALLACEPATEPLEAGSGGMDLRVTASGSAVALESGRVHIDGPTNKTVSATPGVEITVTGLLPGSYTVTLEGFVGDEVTHFGRATGIQVVAGQNTAATIALNAFGPPGIEGTNFTEIPTELSLSIAAVTNAASYTVEWDTNPSFPEFTTVPVSGTSTTIDLGGEVDLYYVRIRAVDPYGASSPASQTLALTLIGFEHYPGGAPSCGACTVTSDFASLGIDLQWNQSGGTCPPLASLADGNFSAYGDAGNPDNHFVTAATIGGGTGGGCTGSLVTLVSGEPHAMVFDWGTTNSTSAFPVLFYDANGEIPASQISRVPLRTYTSVGGFEFKWDLVSVTSPTGIHQIVFDMSGLIQQIDNIRILP